VSKALDATSRNLDAAPPHAMNSLSMAPRWVYGRRPELVTRAFTLSVRRESSCRSRSRASFWWRPCPGRDGIMVHEFAGRGAIACARWRRVSACYPTSVGPEIRHAASRFLARMERDKAVEERRFLDAFLLRLGLTPHRIDKSECPDFFLHFGSGDSSVDLGCELVRFHAKSDGVTTLAHANRWKRFAERLRTALHAAGIHIYGAVHGGFEGLLANETTVIAELRGLLTRTRVREGSIDSFDPSLEPTLAAFVSSIYIRSTSSDAPELWWCGTLQTGPVEDPWPVLRDIIAKKSEKATSWRWGAVDERWLLVVGEAQALSDTMVLVGPAEGGPPTSSFTRVFAWDAFSEKIHQVLPVFGTVFELRSAGAVVRRSLYPSCVARFANLDSSQPAP
jgi:hypothetical protein